MSDFRALCAELLSALESEGYAHWVNGPDEDDLCLRARAAMADEPEAAPAPPFDGEVAELVAWLRMQGEAQKPGPNSLLGAETKKELRANGARLTRAAELLQRQVPVPVAVSERWPEFSDCDDAGLVWCWNWAIGTWRLGCINLSIHSHWLPAHALPVPEVNND